MTGIRDWLATPQPDVPSFTGGLEKDAQRTLARAERSLTFDDERDERTARAALDEVAAEIDKLVEAGKSYEKACDTLRDEVAELGRIVESLAGYLPFTHLEDDPERADELATWCRRNLSGDWEELWLHGRLLLILSSPSDQVLFKMRWL